MAKLIIIEPNGETVHKTNNSFDVSAYQQNNTLVLDIPYQDINYKMCVIKLQLDASETAHLISKLASRLMHIV